MEEGTGGGGHTQLTAPPSPEVAWVMLQGEAGVQELTPWLRLSESLSNCELNGTSRTNIVVPSQGHDGNQ